MRSTLFTPSIETLKSVRKWRDRVFLLKERALARWQLPDGKRVLFTHWPDIVEPLNRAFAGSRHSIAFGHSPTVKGDHDVVVPFSIAALLEAGEDAELCRRNPLPIPSRAAIELCDDKAALISLLRRRGFSAHVPADTAAGTSYPYMLKKRQDAFARNAHRISGPGDEAAHAAEISSGDYVAQEWITGDTEYSAHLLYWGGRLRRAVTVRFLMDSPLAIRGQDPVLLQRRCRNRHLPFFTAILREIGFEGLCCVNYKERAGAPLILEINPRFGFTLAQFFPALLRSLRWPRP